VVGADTETIEVEMFSVMRRLAFACVALLAVTTSSNAQEPFPGLDAYIAKARADWKIPALGVAIVRNDSVIFAKGYGVLKAEANTPADENTLFEIGSSSKSFTATIVAMLVTDGKLRWDDRLTSYLPDFRMRDPVANAEATIRDALSHRTGLARHDLSWMSAGNTRAEVLRRVRFVEPSFIFRTRYQYQNMMFLAAGEAAAKAAGGTWEDLVQQRIFNALGMTRSIPVLRDASSVQNLASPHGLNGDTAWSKDHMSMDNIAPAGSIVASARDMAQYLRFQLGDGTFGGKRLVSAAALRETHVPQMLLGGGGGGGGGGADTLTRFNTYGMGWFVQDYRGHLVWQHGGNTDGMTAAMGLLPSQKLGVVVLSNMNGAALPGLIMNYVFDRQLRAPMRDLSAEALARVAAQRQRADSVAKAQLAQKASGPPPLPLTAYVGEYADSIYGDASVKQADGGLTMTRGSWTAPLEYWNGTTFRWGRLPSATVTSMFVRFDISPEGRVVTLSYGLGADSAHYGRKPNRPATATRTGQ
jgi:CubicO group peptidase (beta-lactamase class C family)